MFIHHIHVQARGGPSPLAVAVREELRPEEVKLAFEGLHLTHRQYTLWQFVPRINYPDAEKIFSELEPGMSLSEFHAVPPRSYVRRRFEESLGIQTIETFQSLKGFYEVPP